MSSSEQGGSFDTVQARLNQIADQVGNADLPLEEALDLYEEAVKLGLQASSLIEQDTQAYLQEEPQDGEQNS